MHTDYFILVKAIIQTTTGRKKLGHRLKGLRTCLGGVERAIESNVERGLTDRLQWCAAQLCIETQELLRSRTNSFGASPLVARRPDGRAVLADLLRLLRPHCTRPSGRAS